MVCDVSPTSAQTCGQEKQLRFVFGVEDFSSADSRFCGEPVLCGLRVRELRERKTGSWRVEKSVPLHFLLATRLFLVASMS